MSSSMRKTPTLTDEQVAQLQHGESIEYRDSRYIDSSYLLHKHSDKLLYFQLPQGFILPSLLEEDLKDKLNIKQTENVGAWKRRQNSGVFQGEFRTGNFSIDQAKEALNDYLIAELSEMKSTQKAKTFAEKKGLFGMFKKK